MENYSPIFTSTPQNTIECWKLIRNFIESWYEIDIPQIDYSEEIKYIESELHIMLPVSFKEYIKLSKQLMSTDITHPNGYKSNNYSHIFRDIYKVERLDEHKAYSLMLQAEGDLYWAVKDEDMNFEDPPVHMYIMDYNSNIEKFNYYKQYSNNLSSFVFMHLSNFIYKTNTGGFGTTISKSDTIIQTISNYFDNSTEFGEIKIYEKENLIALLYPDIYGDEEDEYHFSLEMWKGLNVDSIPNQILELTKHGGNFHGVFIDYINRRKKE